MNLVSNETEPTMNDMVEGWRNLAKSDLATGWHWQLSEERPVYIYNFTVEKGIAHFATLVNMFFPDAPQPVQVGGHKLTPDDLLVPATAYHGECPLKDLVKIMINPGHLEY